MKKKPPVFQAASLMIANIIQAALLLNKDSFVIHFGIRAYNLMRLGSALAVLTFAVWTGLAIRLYVKTRRIAAVVEQKTYLNNAVPEKKDLDEAARNAMYRELADFRCKKWSSMAGISRLLAQLDSMNEYQAEMGRLLDQTRYLAQRPADIVQKVEDCMYVNIRKLLNYMRIVQTRDQRIMQAKISECEAKNAGLLKKTDDFIVAVVAYINGDIAIGEEEKAKTSVDEYMYVVLQAIELPETRLG